MGKFSEYILTAVKGACMGAADVIPGVSGGTIAFIMGIYDKFVASLAAINAEAVKLFFTGKFKEFWRHINGGFLLSLVVGIGVSVISIATVMQTLLSDFPIQTWAFFFGLIVASSIFILRGISGWGLREILFLIGGILLGVTICTLSPTQTPEALWFIFLSGAIAICAMILPGISGSFILLILGKYQYILGAVSDLVAGQDVVGNLLIIGVFAIGAVVGILSFSKLLHWLLSRWRKQVLIILAGFIIGSLVKIWPWNNPEAIAQTELTGSLHIGSAIIIALIGFSLVTGIEIAGKITANKK